MRGSDLQAGSEEDREVLRPTILDQWKHPQTTQQQTNHPTDMKELITQIARHRTQIITERGELTKLRDQDDYLTREIDAVAASGDIENPKAIERHSFLSSKRAMLPAAVERLEKRVAESETALREVLKTFTVQFNLQILARHAELVEKITVLLQPFFDGVAASARAREIALQTDAAQTLSYKASGTSVATVVNMSDVIECADVTLAQYEAFSRGAV